MKDKIKILIIDDEPLVQKILIEELQGEGFYPISSLDGEDGLKKAVKEKPDMILLDIIMPKMDGISVLKKLKADKETKEIPIIILTNLREGATVDISQKSGVLDYLIKADYTLGELIAKIKKIMPKNVNKG